MIEHKFDTSESRRENRKKKEACVGVISSDRTTFRNHCNTSHAAHKKIPILYTNK